MNLPPTRILPSFLCGAALTTGGLPGPLAAQSEVTAPPNIIFVLTDDLGFGDLGVYYQNARRAQGLPGMHTPNLDQMAAAGVRMDRHYCPSPVCAPTRASLLSGLHQGHANLRDNEFDKALEDNHTLASVLHGAGYATAAIGKWGIGGDAAQGFPGHPLKRGFDYFYGVMHHADAHYHYPKAYNQRVYDGYDLVTADLDKAYSTDLFTARAKHWIVDQNAADADQPFFLYLAYTAPHARLEVPTQAYPAGTGLTGGMQWSGTPGAVINTASGSIDSWIHPDYAGKGWPAHAERHATMIRRLDDAMGDLMALLDDLGIAENTLIIFTSDNGPHHEAGNGGSIAQDPRFFRTYGGLDGVKRDVWEGGIRVPTLAHWPGVLPAGRVSTRPSQFHDWLPTFAGLAGLDAPFRGDGVSLWEDLVGTADLPDGEVYVEYTTKWHLSTPGYADFHASHRGATRGHMQAVYLDGYKGVRYNVQSPSDPFRVYDTLNDPQETTDLAGGPGVPTQTELEAKVLRMRRSHPPDPDRSPVRATDGVPVPALTLSGSVPGLTARVYEGNFPHVPAFRDATPVTTAEVNGLSLPPLSRDHDIGLSYTGWLMVPATGEYTFYLTTDTAAVLRLHDILVVDADFAYAGGTERASGPIALEAGLHPLRLHTRHADGPPELALSWSGPGIARQPVPAEALVSKAPDAVPVAQDVTTTTEGGEPVSVAVLAPDAPAGWAIVSVDSPVGAQTEVDGHAIIYTPTPGFFGTDRFGYTISDGETSSSAQVVVEVHYNDPDRLWLPFDEGTGERLRDAGGRPIATGYNGTQWVAGPSGHALAFDGAAAHVWVDAGYTPPSGVSARTVTAWIKADGTGSIVAWGAKEPGRKWHFRLENAAGFVGQLRIEVEGGYRRGATSLLDGAWHHVAVVLPDGATNVDQARLYVDGFEDLPYATVPQVIDTATGRVEIGTDNHDTPRYFNGRIDEVRIHRRALPQSEITALAAAPVQTAAAWHVRHFGPAETNWQQDDGQTGFSRLQRLALGLHPWRPDPAAGPAAHLEEHLLVFTYQRPSGDFYPLEYNIELSHDLQEWRDGDGIAGWSVFPNEAGLEHVEVRVPVDSDAPRLLRLRIDLQE